MAFPSSFLPPRNSGGREVAIEVSELRPTEAPAQLVGQVLQTLDRRAIYLTTKRILDIALALFGLIVCAPIFLLVAVLIKLTDGGPVFFVQKRVGKDGVEFDFYKFRSMVLHADQIKEQLLAANQHGDHRTFKLRNDPRITPLGRILRRTSLDELPQLWNVLKGDMSIVGPRPPVPQEVALYSEIDRLRLRVQPGLTCLWQISGRAHLPFEKQLELDIAYIMSQSLLLDLQIIARTIPAVISGMGAF
jgi:lipopolysaccharide/colanic/teichoic acid biosynthesis glycosyltransferase